MSKLHSFFAAFTESYPGVDPTGTYCLMTGRMIGTNHEVIELVESSDMDVEELADDIAIRLFASMRPGLFWNKMNLKSVANLQESRPVETLAWLLNRLLNPPQFKGDVFAINHDRIRTFQWCLTLDFEVRNELIDRLIALDARLNLNAQLPDFTFDTLSAKAIHLWLESAEKQADKREKAMELQTRWYRDGNTMSKAAAVQTFAKKKPESPAKVANTEKRQTAAMMDNLLAALMTGTATPDSRSVSTPKTPVAGTTPKPTGLSFLAKKKAS
jgi:hypothetical protein